MPVLYRGSAVPKGEGAVKTNIVQTVALVGVSLH
jgi:hypothetical protein